MSYLREANHVNKFRVFIQGNFKSWKTLKFRTSLYTTYWVVLPSYKAYSIWMETWQRLRHEKVKCRVRLYSHKRICNI